MVVTYVGGREAEDDARGLRIGFAFGCRLRLTRRVMHSSGGVHPWSAWSFLSAGAFGFVSWLMLWSASLRYPFRFGWRALAVWLTKVLLQLEPTMSTFEEDEIEVTEGVESEEEMDVVEEMDFVEEMGLREEKKVDDRMSIGSRAYGCKHYRRRCRLRAPCCNEIFDCRHCHNEAKNSNEVDDSKRHDIPRHRVEKVICSLCDHEQGVKQVCENCGVCMGDYYCVKCKFFDDETEKEQYHCDACGICRVGGRGNFFHCDRCGSCYSNALQNGHPCVENANHQNCPVCVEYLFDSVMDISVLPCGHTMHQICLEEMNLHSQFCCPICSRSTQNMSRVWDQLDQEVYLTPMPEEYRQKKVWILCNDCGTTSDVYYHVIGHKCSGCGSYNTRSTCPPSQSRRAEPRPSMGMLPGGIESSVTPNPTQSGRTLAAEMSAE